MIDIQFQAKQAEQFLKANRDEIVRRANSGCTKSKNVISFHRMLVAHADTPTWGLLFGSLDELEPRWEHQPVVILPKEI